MFARTSEFGAAPSGGPRRPERAEAPRETFGPYGVELRRGGALEAIAEPWRRLARAALVANPFAEFATLAAAARHLPEGRRLEALSIWREERLVGVLPLAAPGLGLGPRTFAPWRAPLVPLATPLLDAREARGALEAALAFARSRGAPLVLGDVPAGSALAELAAALGLAPVPGGSAEASPAGVPSPKGLVVSRVRAAPEIRDAVEIALALEAEEARAARREALIQDPGRASLVRTATRRAAAERACLVAIARREGAPVGAAIALRGLAWIVAGAPDAVAALAREGGGLPARLDWRAPAPSARGLVAPRPRDLVGAARRLIARAARPAALGQ